MWCGILIFRNSKGNKSRFGKVGSSRNQGYNDNVLLRGGKQFWFELSRGLKN